MVIVKIIGGLGNQMFQYAMGFCLAKKNNSVCKLDISDFSIYKLHKYSLNYFNIHLEEAIKSEINILKNPPTTIKTKIKSKLGFSNRKVNPHHIIEKDFSFDQNTLNLKGDYYINGYWQSEKYFINYQDLIRDEFKVKSNPDRVNAEYINKITNSESVSIHIRHGDYLTDKKTKSVHGVLPLEYYHKAIEIMEKQLHHPNYFVFSDDIEWAKENLPKDIPIFFMDHNDADHNYEDMRLMSNCKYNIIANSSFSWWGAWLNSNPNKLVIAPQKWFGDRTKETNDLIPENWVRI
ncbi:MAG: alpha-1,2-fucosyltransferase [Patescibacteria group bacterium]